MLAKVLIAFLIGLSFSDFVELVDVKTTSGVVRGKSAIVANKTINQFVGIPYAEPPVGKLRFAKPVPLKEPKKDIIDATKSGHSCLQHATTNLQEYSEDCLILNIFAPNSTQLKPVMFWIYGGGLNHGSSSHTDLSILATHDVVMVTVNYRLGPFGFLYSGDESAPGNMGFFDQNLALKWVKQNIHSFGGDPNQVTIFGQSAGSWSVSAQIMSPLSKGLFHRAILQSGAVYHNKDIPNLTKEDALNRAKIFAKHFNCTTDKWMDCLKALDSKILETYTYTGIYAIPETEFLPLTAQHAFKALKYNSDIDIMGGVMQNEGGGNHNGDNLKNAEEFKVLISKDHRPNLDHEKIAEFYLKNINTSDTKALVKAYRDYSGDIFLTCPTYHFSKAFSENTPHKNAYFYEWTYIGDDVRNAACTKEMGICHSYDVGYVFGRESWKDAVDKKFSEDVMKIWTNFAKTGRPLDGFPSDYHWPRMTQVGSSNSVIKVKDMSPLKPNLVFDNLFAKTCDGFWKSYYN